MQKDIFHLINITKTWHDFILPFHFMLGTFQTYIMHYIKMYRVNGICILITETYNTLVEDQQSPHI